MKNILLSFLCVWNCSVQAQVNPNFEIPVSNEDWVVSDQPKVSHQQYRVKRFRCKNEDFGILYKSYWGWSRGSQFIGVCKWENRFSISNCESDSEPNTVECYYEVIEQFKINQTIQN